MIIQWVSKFDSVQMLWLLLSSFLLMISLLPGCIVLFTRGLKLHAPMSGPADWFRFAIIHATAWILILFSLAFGPSAGTMPMNSSSSAPMGLEQMISEANQVVDQRHLFGRGGVLGNLYFAGFRNMEVQGNADEPLFASRRVQHSVSLTAFLCQQLCVYLCAVLSVMAVASTGRANPSSILVFSLFWGALIYAPAVHWVWGEGWLGLRGAVDTGGSLFMLIVGGSILGVGRYRRKKNTEPDRSSLWGRWDGVIRHAATVAFFFGYLALMCSLSVPVAQLRAVALLNGITAACGGFLVYALLQMLLQNRTHHQTALTGLLCGLITVAAGCTVFDPQTSLTCGVLGGATGYLVSTVAFRLHFPMALETPLAVSVSAVLGMLVVGICGSSANGMLHWNRDPINSIMHGETRLLGTQALAAACILVYVVIASRLLSMAFLRTARVEQAEEGGNASA